MAENIGKQLKNTELAEAIKNVKGNETPETIKALFNVVNKSSLIVPAKIDGPTKADSKGQLIVPKEAKINFSLLTNSAGEKVLPCFTDDVTVGKSQFANGFNMLIMEYTKLVEIVLGSNGAISGIAINPFTDNCYLSGDFIKNYTLSLKGGLVKTTMEPGTKFQLRTPKYPPVQMLQITSDFLSRHEDVDRAFMQMMEEEGKEDKYLIVLDTKSNEMELIKELIPLIKPHAFGIELAFVTTRNPIGMKVTELTDPFYTRKGYEPPVRKDISDSDSE